MHFSEMKESFSVSRRLNNFLDLFASHVQCYFKIHARYVIASLSKFKLYTFKVKFPPFGWNYFCRLYTSFLQDSTAKNIASLNLPTKEYIPLLSENIQEKKERRERKILQILRPR